MRRWIFNNVPWKTVITKVTVLDSNGVATVAIAHPKWWSAQRVFEAAVRLHFPELEAGDAEWI